MSHPTISVDKVEVHWPSGLVERVSLPAVDGYFTVEEGKGFVRGVSDRVAENSGN